MSLALAHHVVRCRLHLPTDLMLRCKMSLALAHRVDAWKSEAQRNKFRFSAVAHVKMQFTKRVYRKKLLTGTQKIDGFWKLLKRYGAPQIRTRDPKFWENSPKNATK